MWKDVLFGMEICVYLSLIIDFLPPDDCAGFLNFDWRIIDITSLGLEVPLYTCITVKDKITSMIHIFDNI